MQVRSNEVVDNCIEIKSLCFCHNMRGLASERKEHIL